MIGDQIALNERYLQPAVRVLEGISVQKGYVINVAGESGSGKSTLAVALQHVLKEQGMKAVVLHMDDYFILPPATNHAKRESDINWVGPGEVRLDLLQHHIGQFKAGCKTIDKPLVDYAANQILEEKLDLSDVEVLIVEGTYTSLLQVDKSIFLERTYVDTFADRVKRARDPITPFVEQVLEVEHRIISAQGQGAAITIDKNFGIKFRDSHA